jgi:hypothetical protein
MAGGSAADGAATEQFGGDEFDRPPMPLPVQQVFGLGQQTAFQPLGVPLPGPLHSQSPHILLVAGGRVPGVVAGVLGFRRDTAQGDEDFPLQPIFRGSNSSLLEFAPAQLFLLGQHADPLHVPAQRQGHDCMAGFVIRGGFIAAWFHPTVLAGGRALSNLGRTLVPAEPFPEKEKDDLPFPRRFRMERLMRTAIRLILAVVPLCFPGVAFGTETPVTAVVESSLPTAPEQIRQFAFDGNPDSFFASKKNPGKEDHFTLTFDKPVAVQSLTVVTGRPKGEDKLNAGTLEVSTDGKAFTPLATFKDGTARGEPKGQMLKAVRIRFTEDVGHPLVIREITVVSEPKVAIFTHPIEFLVDVSDAPEMKEWAEKVARVCERQYPLICEELKSPGYKPPHWVTMTLRNDYRGVAATGGGRITGSVKFFKDHPDDIGAMVHETVHVVQRYRTRGNPGWLVEGVADYYRFFKYEPGKIGRINPDRARYNGSYRTTAAFLAYVTDKHDKEIVRKLNQAMREGKYKEELFKEYTGKTVQELDTEWRATLKK